MPKLERPYQPADPQRIPGSGGAAGRYGAENAIRAGTGGRSEKEAREDLQRRWREEDQRKR